MTGSGLAKSSMAEKELPVETSVWWSGKRFQYNVGLVATGLIAFVLYLFILDSCIAVIPGAEITLFTILLQGIVYLMAIAFANICFLLGPLTEKLIKPRDVNQFRKITYRFGFWFSIALPQLLPLVAFIKCNSNN